MSVLLKKTRGIIIFALILTSLIYPVYGAISKARAETLTLDSAAHVHFDDATVIEWLKTAPDGVILEAVGGSYTGYARISTNSGLPTVLGWPGHESQWRGGYEEIGSRQGDVEIIYTTNDWEETKFLLDKYNVHYVIVGALEESTYRVNFRKFEVYFEEIFSQGSTRIYIVR